MKSSQYPAANEALSFAMDLGKSMIMCSAQIDRVEETIMRVCSAYGALKTDVFSIVSMINVTVTDRDGSTYTQLRRVYKTSTNLGKLERLNALSRDVCAGGVSLSDARRRLDEIEKKDSRFHLTALLGSVLAAASFTVFFRGSLLDAAASIPIAVMIYFINTFLPGRGMSRLFYTAVCSFLSSFFAIMFVKIGFGSSAASIMIGDIMLLIPGLMLINSIREMLCGDLMSGLLRFTETVLLSVTIAFGFSIPMLIFM